MRVQLQNNASSKRFAKKWLNIANGKMTIDRSTQCITLPTIAHLGKMTTTKDQLIKMVLAKIAWNYENCQRLCARTILATVNNDANVICFIFQNGIPGEVFHYPTEFLISLDLSGMPSHI